jgi:mRNA interferase MazF
MVTSDPTDLPVFRIPVVPTPGNCLRTTSRLMVYRVVTTAPRSCLGHCIGRLTADDLLRLNRSLPVDLGLAR